MDEQISIPKFRLRNVVRCNKGSGCQLVGEITIIISRKYIKTEYWSGRARYASDKKHTYVEWTRGQGVGGTRRKNEVYIRSSFPLVPKSPCPQVHF